MYLVYIVWCIAAWSPVQYQSPFHPPPQSVIEPSGFRPLALTIWRWWSNPLPTGLFDLCNQHGGGGAIQHGGFWPWRLLYVGGAIFWRLQDWNRLPPVEPPHTQNFIHRFYRHYTAVGNGCPLQSSFLLRKLYLPPWRWKFFSCHGANGKYIKEVHNVWNY